MGTVVNSVEGLLEAAARRTGLDDFEAGSFREGLEIAHRSNVAGRPPAALLERIEANYVDALTNRLRLTDWVKRQPQLRVADVTRPLFLFGMPRSGTTLASYLLGQDPARRSLLLWEALDSAPPPTTATLKSDPRCTAMLAQQAAEHAANPTAVRPHVEFADGPTECIRLHSQDFKALVWEGLMPVPEYSRWILQADMTSAYRYQKMALQVLQSSAPGPWALKMPSHALHIEALLKVFPDARLVWVHRDPHRALASLFSMKSTRWKQMTGEPHIEWLREHYTVQLREHLNRPLRVRERLGADRVYDLSYADLMRDPIPTMRGLYAWAGDEYTADAEAGMRAWLARNPQGRFGQHRYGLDDFGLSEAALRPYFSDYFDVFSTEREG